MNKHTIRVLLIIHLCFHLNTCLTWNKCCDESSNLKVNKTSYINIYECVNVNNTEYNEPLLIRDFFEGIPKNCFDNVTCVDKLVDAGKANGAIISLKCENMRKLDNLPYLQTINKCCPDGLYYNKKLKVCEPEVSSSVQQLKEIVLADVYNINYGFPNCNRRVFFMEIEYENISIYITTNGTLELTLIEDNFMQSFENGSYCIDTRLSKSKGKGKLNAIIAQCNPLPLNVKEECTNNICVPKCCPMGHVYKKGITKVYECFPEWETPFAPSFGNGTTESVPDFFHIMNQPTCPHGKYLADDYTLMKNGTFKHLRKLFYHSYTNKYCIEWFNTSKMHRYVGVICFSKKTENHSKFEPKFEPKTFIHLFGLIISILFLAITLTIYFFLPEIQNLHWRTVMSHITSLLAAYICLALVKQPTTKFSYSTCMILGYGILFAFLSAFTWLNVMFFDIWWTFGVVQARGITKNKDLKKFLYYCTYAHGLPFIITTIAIGITVDLHPDIPDIYKPNIAQYSCRFNVKNKVPLEFTIFFVTPVGTLITCNIILFILTTRHCLKIRRDIQRMQHDYSTKKKSFLADRATFLVNVKLFIVMGITWAFELISAYVTEPEALWIFFDTINVLQVLWIFCIFVFKNNVWKAIKKKLGYEIVQDRSGSTQNTTLSTKMSIASNTSIRMNHLKQEEKDLLQNVVNRDRERNED